MNQNDEIERVLGALGRNMRPVRLTSPVVADAQQTHRIARRRRQSHLPQNVYFIKASTGQIKIGLAVDPFMRLGELQVAHPEPLTLLGYCAGGAALESALHIEFTADWIRGEWFRPTERLLAKIREMVNS